MMELLKTLLISADRAFTWVGCWLLIATLFHVPATLVTEGWAMPLPMWIISSLVGVLGTLFLFPRIYHTEEEDGSPIIKF